METIKRTKIVDVLKSEAFGTTVNVKGWVRTRRGSKQVNFIALNDGSTINNVQIVVDVDKLGDEFLKPITTGASISVNGILTQSQGKGQSVEIQATEIEIFGTADPATYPLHHPVESGGQLHSIYNLIPVYIWQIYGRTLSIPRPEHQNSGCTAFRDENIPRGGLTIGRLARNGKFSFVTILKHVSLTTRGLSGILVDPPRL